MTTGLSYDDVAELLAVVGLPVFLPGEPTAAYPAITMEPQAITLIEALPVAFDSVEIHVRYPAGANNPAQWDACRTSTYAAVAAFRNTPVAIEDPEILASFDEETTPNTIQYVIAVTFPGLPICEPKQTQLADALLWLDGRQHAADGRGSSDDWLNGGTFGPLGDAVPAAAAAFVDNAGDGYWLFTTAADEKLVIADNDGLDLNPETGITVLARCRVADPGGISAQIINKKADAGADENGWMFRAGFPNQNMAIDLADGLNYSWAGTDGATFGVDQVAGGRRALDEAMGGYFDGDPTPSGGEQSEPIDLDDWPNTLDVTIGAIAADDTRNLDGRIYSIAVFDSALSDDDIARLSAEMTTPTT